MAKKQNSKPIKTSVECKHLNTYIPVRHVSGVYIRRCQDCNKIVNN